MGGMRLYKHAVTGSVGEYPDHYGDIFPHLEPYEGDDYCLDCIPQVITPDEPDMIFEPVLEEELTEEYDYE